MKFLTLYFDKTHQTHPYTGVLTKQLENCEVCTGLSCKAKTHKVSPACHAPGSPREQGHRLPTVPVESTPGPRVVSIRGQSRQAACPGGRTCTSENLPTSIALLKHFSF